MPVGPVATVKSGSVRIPIYYLPSRNTHMAKWTEGGKPRKTRNRDLAELKKEVKKIAKAIDSGTVDFSTLTPAQKAACQEVIARGITVDQLTALCSLKPTSTQEAATEFLASKEDSSLDHQHSLQVHLSQFCKAFGNRPISSIETIQIDKWLVTNATNLRTRKNKRGTIVSLWRWARDKGYLPQDTRTAAERTDAPSSRKQKREQVIETWTPTELQAILGSCPEEYLPWVVLSAFAGIRTNEIFLNDKSTGEKKAVLQWEHFRFDDERPRIIVPSAISKTSTQRTTPICPTLLKWLVKFREESGPVINSPSPWRKLKQGGGKSANEFISEAAGVDFKKNAFRHSFGTYRVIQKGGEVGAVALEMGNSEAIIKSNYLDAGRTEAEAKKWFALTPAKVKRK